MPQVIHTVKRVQAVTLLETESMNDIFTLIMQLQHEDHLSNTECTFCRKNSEVLCDLIPCYGNQH